MRGQRPWQVLITNMYSIAIDGPAGAGKSTIAKSLSKELSISYVDTGAMYRSVALWTIEENIDVENEEEIEKRIDEIKIQVVYEDEEQKIYLDEKCVNDRIREEKVGNLASIVAKYKKVRAYLVDLQREIAKNNSVIMDGRDIGTTVLKDAFLKIYLTADAKIRAKRRCEQLKEKNVEADEEKILKDIEERDYIDKNRENSPLKIANDAIVIDSSNKTEREVIDEIKNIYLERKKNARC